MLKISLTDGVQNIIGMEYQPILSIKTTTPPGCKVRRNVRITGFLAEIDCLLADCMLITMY